MSTEPDTDRDVLSTVCDALAAGGAVMAFGLAVTFAWFAFFRHGGSGKPCPDWWYYLLLGGWIGAGGACFMAERVFAQAKNETTKER